MGKLQGPRATPGPRAQSGAPSAGFMTLSRRGYYKYIFYAEAGDAVAFTGCPTSELASVLAAASPPVLSPARGASWMWTWDFSEAVRERAADHARRRQVEEQIGALAVEEHLYRLAERRGGWSLARAGLQQCMLLACSCWFAGACCSLARAGL